MSSHEPRKRPQGDRLTHLETRHNALRNQVVEVVAKLNESVQKLAALSHKLEMVIKDIEKLRGDGK